MFEFCPTFTLLASGKLHPSVLLAWNSVAIVAISIKYHAFKRQNNFTDLHQFQHQVSMQRSQSDATTRLYRLISQSHKIPTANLRLCNKWIQRSITVAKEPFDHEARHRGTETENCSESFRLLERCVVSANQIRLQRNNVADFSVDLTQLCLCHRAV